jgi:prepilin-type N-terminal cleavage/methylation domain-containing protein
MKKLKRNKGFTLIELIVVIVIVAILIAALTPAILGILDAARLSADEADTRDIMLAASVAALASDPPPPPAPPVTNEEIREQLTGGTTHRGLTVMLFYENNFCTGALIVEGGRTDKSDGLALGNTELFTSFGVYVHE